MTVEDNSISAEALIAPKQNRALFMNERDHTRQRLTLCNSLIRVNSLAPERVPYGPGWAPREALVEQALAAVRKRANLLLWGPPGVGKRSLAIMTTERTDWTTCIIDSRTSAAPDKSQQAVIFSLQAPSSSREAKTDERKLLKSVSDRKCIFIASSNKCAAEIERLTERNLITLAVEALSEDEFLHVAESMGLWDSGEYGPTSARHLFEISGGSPLALQIAKELFAEAQNFSTLSDGNLGRPLADRLKEHYKNTMQPGDDIDARLQIAQLLSDIPTFGMSPSSIMHSLAEHFAENDHALPAAANRLLELGFIRQIDSRDTALEAHPVIAACFRRPEKDSAILSAKQRFRTYWRTKISGDSPITVLSSFISDAECDLDPEDDKEHGPDFYRASALRFHMSALQLANAVGDEAAADISEVLVARIKHLLRENLDRLPCSSAIGIAMATRLINPELEIGLQLLEAAEKDLERDPSVIASLVFGASFHLCDPQDRLLELGKKLADSRKQGCELALVAIVAALCRTGSETMAYYFATGHFPPSNTRHELVEAILLQIQGQHGTERANEFMKRHPANSFLLDPLVRSFVISKGGHLERPSLTGEAEANLYRKRMIGELCDNSEYSNFITRCLEESETLSKNPPLHRVTSSSVRAILSREIRAPVER